MLCAGIDIGSLTAEAVIVENGKLRGSRIMSVLPNPVDSAKTVMGGLLDELGLAWSDLGYAVSTGYGREKIQECGLAQENVSEISCHGFGAFNLNPKVRTVIDIGGQDAKVIKLGAAGKLENFVMNDKCAAGTGHFLEVMSRSLGVKLEELGPMSRASKQPALMSNRCTIYVETEVIHFLQRGVDKVDIAAGINRAMAERVTAMVSLLPSSESAVNRVHISGKLFFGAQRSAAFLSGCSQAGSPQHQRAYLSCKQPERAREGSWRL